MLKIHKARIERMLLVGCGTTLAVLFLVGGIALNYAEQSIVAIKIVQCSIILLLLFLAVLYARIQRESSGPGTMFDVRLMVQKLDGYNVVLEETVQARTAELRKSEARFKGLTELSSDWYWEQDAEGRFTSVSGPALEMLGMKEDAAAVAGGSNEAGRAKLGANIAARLPFLDLVYSRTLANGTLQTLRVSGEPIFDAGSRFIGYRGVGTDISGSVDRRR